MLGWGLAVGIYFAAAYAINSMLADQLANGQQVCILLPEHYAMSLAVTVGAAVLAAAPRRLALGPHRAFRGPARNLTLAIRLRDVVAVARQHSAAVQAAQAKVCSGSESFRSYVLEESTHEDFQPDSRRHAGARQWTSGAAMAHGDDHRGYDRGWAPRPT